MIGMHKRLVTAIIFVLFLSLVLVSIPVKAQTTNSIVINPDGSVTGIYSIQQVGSTYTLTSNVSGNIHVEKSGIVINGSGYWLNGNGAVGITLNDQNSYPTISVNNVTIENLHITDCSNGIFSNGGGNNTFYDDSFSNFEYGGFAIELMGCSYNNITYCTFDNQTQISMDYSANFNTVTESNLPAYGILVWLSGYETVDRNYWVGYSTKNPNATEVDHTGVGNQPYVYYTAQNGTQPVYYQDNHPLMKPVSIPLLGSSTQATVPEFPDIAILPFFLSLLTVGVITMNRKIKHG
jgi:hypothetical protein